MTQRTPATTILVALGQRKACEWRVVTRLGPVVCADQELLLRRRHTLINLPAHEVRHLIKQRPRLDETVVRARRCGRAGHLQFCSTSPVEKGEDSDDTENAGGDDSRCSSLGCKLDHVIRLLAT